MNDIGKELKELRLLKGLTLKELSDLTRINIKYLEYLEQNNFTFMPEVYVRSFLKTYVKYLGGDEKKFLEIFEEILHPKIKEKSELEKEVEIQEIENENKIKSLNFFLGKTNILTFKNVLFFGSALIFLFVILILIFSKGSDNKTLVTTKTEEKMFEESYEDKTQNFTNFVSSDSLILGINAMDSVWIQVKMDDSKIEEVYMRSGEAKKFKAKNDFQLLVGNAGGIVLYLNETELPFSGVKGSVKRLKIDKEGLKLIQVKNELKRQ
ncbi:MAG: helix-turn-helix domain-containing protein [Ignavibacteria bacterium]